MKQLQSKLWAKITALILLTIFAVGLFFSAIAVAYLIDSNAYLDPAGFENEALGANAFYSYMDDAAGYYTEYLQQQAGNGSGSLSYYEQEFSRENSNFFFTVQDEDGKTVFESPGADDAFRYSRTQERYLSYNWRDVTEEDHVFASEAEYQDYLARLNAQNFTIYETYLMENTAENVDAPRAEETGAPSAEETDGPVHAYISYQRFDYAHVSITGYIRTELTARDGIFRELYYQNLLLDNRNVLVGLSIGLFVLCLVLFIFLLCAAGHKEGVEGISLNWVDKIPLDLYLAAMALAICAVAACGIDATSIGGAAAVVLVGIALACGVLLILGVFMTLSTRFKSGAFWKNTIVYRALLFCGRIFKSLGRGVSYCAQQLPLYWQAGLIFAGASLAELFILAAFSRGTVVAIWVIAKLIEAPLLAFFVISLQKLKAGGEALAAGNLNASVDVKHMYGVLKSHGENLNSIAQGMQKAVQQQLKSERFRTDLITNVSHDIKTPLTSIVNYVDLLKKENVQPEKAKEYITVLDRQSARLKKLTEDLVEASKASSGTLPVQLEAVDVNVLLSQVSGEYQSRFEACRLEPVVKLSPLSPQILADGKLLWRVFDNLLSNICKYAMPGTRVYFTSEVLNDQVQISFKNISNYPLDITADELMERFVRGDSSRSTEGSGLGLSIAQSLTSLQKGSFELVVDGDLFKANVSFAQVNG